MLSANSPSGLNRRYLLKIQRTNEVSASGGNKIRISEIRFNKISARKGKELKNKIQSPMIYFDSDYMEGAHPEVMRRVVETNLEHTVGYGCDP